MATAEEFHKRLVQLQEWLADRQYDGFVLPLTDEYQGEYSADYARRVTWLCGFDGSAGSVAITPTQAALFVDGRYIIQAAHEVSATDYQVFNSTEKRPEEWLLERIEGNGTTVQRARDIPSVCYDPLLYTLSQTERMQQCMDVQGVMLEPCGENPIDRLWEDQPYPPLEPVSIHGIEYAGEPHAQKRQKIGEKLQELRLDAMVLTAPDSICWLLNIRGGDIPYNPLVLSYAVVHHNGHMALFMEPQKMNEEVRRHLSEEVMVYSPDMLGDYLDKFSQQRIGYDPNSSPIWCYHRLMASNADIVEVQDPCMLAKACKNDVEQEGVRQAHVLDGVAVTRFLHWFDSLLEDKSVTEMDVESVLENFRAESEFYRGPSFATISGSAEHGAIVHYRVNESSNRSIESGEVLLLDSGGQYPMGTTDITRTVVRDVELANNTGVLDTFKEHFTAVLRGHIGLARARFPKGTGGSQLDILARRPLWSMGLDYDHGTGHGVGSYLCVHEGPQRISKRGGDTPLRAGMVLSNEPGYYKQGSYGIRIENLVLVGNVPADDMPVGAREFLELTTVTLAPIDTRLVDVDQLTPREQAWLNNYHRHVYDVLSPMLEDDVRAWLGVRCRAI